MEADGYRAYKETSTFVRHVEMPSVLAALPAIGGRSVLDQGCGWGLYAARLAERRPARLVAADISPSMLAAARLHTLASPVPIEFRLADSRAPSGVEEFDVILANFLLPFAQGLPELAKMGLAAQRALKPGGQLVGFVPHCSEALGLEALGHFGFSCHPPTGVQVGDPVPLHFYDDEGQVVLSSRFHWYPPAELVSSLVGSGFRRVELLAPAVDDEGLELYGQRYWTPITHPPRTLIVRATK